MSEEEQGVASREPSPTTTVATPDGAAPGFTEGPWEIEPNAARGAWIKGASGEWAALACGDTDESARSNAHLIAAAPDMYEALRGAIGALEFSRDYHSDLGNEEQAFAQDKLDAALKAIARARGEA